MTIEVWHETTTPEQHERVCGVLHALRGHGVAVWPLEEGTPRGDGLLSFGHVDAPTLEALRRLTRTQRHRVIAIQVAGAILRPADYRRLLRAGADEVIAWSAPAPGSPSPGAAPTPVRPGSSGPAAHAAACVAARLARWREVDAIVDSALVRGRLVGQSAVWRATLRRIVEIACFTDAPVLVTGESGTGKELVARLIHALDRRADKRDLVVVDCTTLLPELVGSELFGHERGAFTGALAARDGACMLADKGTLFLDEIGELPPLLQPQLLRVIQERQFKRLGGNRWCGTQFRLVCATNRRFEEEIEAGRFRADLYYRIADCIVHLPSLRERGEDTLLLAEHLLRELSGGRALALSEPVGDFLMRRAFPGNVRELRQLLSRMCSRHSGNGLITVGDIPEDEWRAGEEGEHDWRDDQLERAIHRALSLGAPLKELSQHTTETAIRLVVDQENGNLQRAARRLGMTDRALQMRRAQQRVSMLGTAMGTAVSGEA